MSTILIADDNEGILESYVQFINNQDLGWNILTAQNENEVEKILKVNHVDIVITDLIMDSKHSGKNILNLSKTKDPLTMVIVVTAFETELDRYKLFELGAFDCIARNTPGLVTINEIISKTKIALKFRELALMEIENQKKLSFMKRYFDPRIFGKIEENPDLLNIRKKNISIIFWDIRGFSLLSENLKEHPTLISGFLKEYFQKSADIIFKHGGVLDKFIGDGVMALFGSFSDDLDEGVNDAVNAVRSAIRMRECFRTIYNEWLKKWQLYTPHKIDIGLGIGIHTGEALVGNVGSESRDQFTALGPHVNFAQRIESRAEKGQILITNTTKSRVSNVFEVNKIAAINDVKNIPGEFEVFEVV